MSKPPPVISAAEWDVMSVLWDAASPRLAADVVAALVDRRDWSPRTVKTLLTRLVKKRAVRFEPRGREYLYAPAVDRDAVVRAESRSFLARVFGGAVGPMLVQFVKQADLSPAEIDQLRRALDDKADPN
jgi:BlaI family penicillinase repressor